MSTKRTLSPISANTPARLKEIVVFPTPPLLLYIPIVFIVATFKHYSGSFYARVSVKFDEWTEIRIEGKNIVIYLTTNLFG